MGITNNQIRYAKLKPDAKAPLRKNKTDAGMDFFSIENATIYPHSMVIIHTGITVEVPAGFFLLLKPKSRNNHLVGAGVVDAYYEPGEIMVKVLNFSDRPLEIKKGDGIAQGILIPVWTAELVETSLEDLENDNARSGQGGIVDQSKGGL